MTLRMTHADVVAANFRNTLIDAIPHFNLFRDDYESCDARILEACYKKLDDMPEEDIEMFYECINAGFELRYDRQTESFEVVPDDKFLESAFADHQYEGDYFLTM